MIKSTILLACAAIALSACAAPGGNAPMTAVEFRLAAEERITWRDPAITSDISTESWIAGKILGFNDFHGNLNGRNIDGRPVGGAAVLAAYLRAQAALVEGRAIIVHAGDHVGASPPVSSLLQDEPSIQFLNYLANDECRIEDRMNPKCNLVGTLGNHELDEGIGEILRLIGGGRHPETRSMDPDWAGAEFPYVSANILDAETGKTILPPYVIKDIGGVPVAFIGAILRAAPGIVLASGVVGLRFTDEVDAINRFVPELQARGVRAIIVTIHQGLRQTTFGRAAIVGQDDLQGEIIDIVTRLDDEIDIVVSGHAHAFTNVLVPNQNGRLILLTQAFSNGTAYGEIDISLDPASGDIVEKSAAIITTWADRGPGLSPDAEIARLVEKANVAVRPLTSRIIGRAAMDIVRAQSEAGESPLGNFIADTQRATMGTDIAFMNPGGLRDDILAGDVSWGELFSTQPFGNILITMQMTGRQIVAALNQQWREGHVPTMLQISGMRYTWDASRPLGDRIVEVRDSAGALMDPEKMYSITANNFLAGGGNGFGAFREASDQITGPNDLDALIDHIEALTAPIEAQIEGRITRLN